MNIKITNNLLKNKYYFPIINIYHFYTVQMCKL